MAWQDGQRLLPPARGDRRFARRATVVACLAIVCVLAALSRQRLRLYESELALWQDAVANQPHNPVARMKLGILLEQAGRGAEALRQLDEATRQGENRPQVHYALARALENAARPADAIEEYRRVLALDPSHPAAHNNLGRLLARFGRSQEAIEHYELAIAGDPRLAEAHSNLGILLSEFGFRHEALRHLEQALELKPDLVAYTNLAVAYSRAGNADLAIEMARRALVLARDAGDATLAAQLELAIRRHEAEPLEN